MNDFKEAIELLRERKAAIQKRIDDDISECLTIDAAIENLEKLAAAELTKCVGRRCADCGEHHDGKVCERYADKVDEIRHIHEEGDNGDKQHK